MDDKQTVPQEHRISAGPRWRGQAPWWDCACGERFSIYDDAMRHYANETGAIITHIPPVTDFDFDNIRGTRYP